MSVDSRALLMVTFSSNNTCQSLKPVYVHILCPGESSFFFPFSFLLLFLTFMLKCGTTILSGFLTSFSGFWKLKASLTCRILKGDWIDAVE